MAFLKPVQEPIVGFGVSGAGVQDAVQAAAPLVQASQHLEQKRINAQKAQEAANYQKLLRSGADGMRAYAAEVGQKYPELGQQLAIEAEQYATFLNDPSITGDKAEGYNSHFFESGNNRYKHMEEIGAKDREAKAKAEAQAKSDQAFAEWDTQSKSEQEKLGFNLKDADINRLAASASPEVQAHKSYQSAMDNLKKKTPQQTTTPGLAFQKDKDFQDRIRAVKKDLETKVPIAQAFADVDKAIPGGIDGTGEIAGVGVGAKPFRKWFMSDSGAKTRAAIATLLNITLKDRSGAAVTENELSRIEEELALTGTSTTEAFRDAIRRKRASLLEEMENAENVDPEASAELMARGFKGTDIVRKTIKTKKAALSKGQKKDFGGGISVERMD